jgi:hypothetical protein
MHREVRLPVLSLAMAHNLVPLCAVWPVAPHFVSYLMLTLGVKRSTRHREV